MCFGEIATLCGRYYAMDRDKRWERTERAYRCLVEAVGERAADPLAAVKRSYERGVTDEFVEPVVMTREDGSPVATIRDGDAVIFFNFRADRARQLTRALAVPGFEEFPTPDRPKVDYVCFTLYDQTFPLPIAFAQLQHKNILAEVFASLGVRNYRLAETEKYAHVTYFFNGGTEREFPGAAAPRPLAQGRDLRHDARDGCLQSHRKNPTRHRRERDGRIHRQLRKPRHGRPHRQPRSKTIEAVQYVDTCLGWITKALRTRKGRCLITADHGNCEHMLDPTTGQPHTAHTNNPVPFHLIDNDSLGVKSRARRSPRRRRPHHARPPRSRQTLRHDRPRPARNLDFNKTDERRGARYQLTPPLSLCASLSRNLDLCPASLNRSVNDLKRLVLRLQRPVSDSM